MIFICRRKGGDFYYLVVFGRKEETFSTVWAGKHSRHLKGKAQNCTLQAPRENQDHVQLWNMADNRWLIFLYCQAQPKVQTKASAFGWDGYIIIIIQPPTCWVPILAKFFGPQIQTEMSWFEWFFQIPKCIKNSWLLLNELYSYNTKSKIQNITICSKQKYFYLKFNGSTPQAGRNSINNFLAFFTF